MKKVLIYCASGYGERVHHLLDEEEYEVIGFVDRNAEVQQQLVCGLKVYAPTEIPKLEYDLIIIAVAEWAAEIKKDLIEKYNVDDSKIEVYLDGRIDYVDERIAALKAAVALQKERGIEGAMAEVGVYRGDFARLLNRYFPERKLYLFDTFTGFDARDNFREDDINDFSNTSVDLVLSRMANKNSCIVKKGYFPDTAAGVEDKFAFVSLDADLYNPILAGLEYFYPRLVKGGYIFIHDFGSYYYTGVRDAVYEYAKQHDIAIVPVLDRCLSVIISK